MHVAARSKNGNIRRTSEVAGCSKVEKRQRTEDMGKRVERGRQLSEKKRVNVEKGYNILTITCRLTEKGRNAKGGGTSF